MNVTLRYIALFILFVFLQIILFNNLVLLSTAIPFVFLLYLFMLPTSIPRPLIMLVGFGVGLTVDLLSDNYANGLHAFSCLLTMTTRQRVISLITISKYKNPNDISLYSQSTIWYAIFLAILIFIHHSAYFILEAFSFQQFGYTLAKIIFSSLYTFIFCYLICLIFYKE